MGPQLAQAWGAWGDIYNTLLGNELGVRQQGQRLDLGKQLLESNTLDLQMKRQQMDLANQYRQQLLNGALLDPTRSNPDTPSIQESTDQRRSPEERALGEMQTSKREAQNNLRLAQAYGMDPKPWITRLDSLDTNIREAAKDVTKRRADQSQQAAQILRDVDSAPAANAALNSIAEQFGNEAARAIDAKLPHDGDGNIIWNDTAKRALAPAVSQYTTMHEKALQAYRGAEVQNQAANRDERIRHDRATEQQRDRELAQQRLNESGRNKRHEDTMKRLGGPDYKLSKDVTAQLDKLAKDYKIIDYKKGVDVADAAASALKDESRGYADVTPPAARTLVNQFKLMIDNYRSRTGGRYQEAELARMNGLLQRLDKFKETIGEGDKVLAKDVMLQTAQQMQKLYTDRATDLTKEELARLTILKNRGGNPMWVPAGLEMQNKIEDLERRGAVTQRTRDGKTYAFFPKSGKENKKEKGPEDFDAFEMPSPPEQKTPVFVE